MSTVRKEYLCQMTIIEARNLQTTDTSGTCDPFVRITCGNLPAQATTCEDSTNSPCWNQAFTFAGLNLTDYELETWELKVECMDFNAFFRNTLIGGFSLGLSTIYRNSNHEFFNIWMTLLHPEYGSQPMGYLLINCFVVGPNDVPPSHAIGDNAMLQEDAEIDDDDDYLDELLTPEQRKAKKDNANRIKVVGAPLFARKAYQLSINLYKAEGLPEAGLFGSTNAFVSVRSGGMVEKTHHVEGNRNPVWNAKISFPAYQPILNDKIVIRLWNRVSMGRDRLIATVPENPKSSDSFNVSTLLSRGGVMPVRWLNLYGFPAEEDSLWRDIKVIAGLARKSYIGNAYVGRILLGITVSPHDEPETGVSRAVPYREPVSKLHVLRVVLYELKNTHGCGDEVRITAKLGPYETKSKWARRKQDALSRQQGVSTDIYIWGSSYRGDNLAEIKEPFPVDTSQVADVVLELWTKTFLGEKRIGFIRRPAVEVLGNDTPRWIPFKSLDMHSDVGDYSPGMLLVTINFAQHTNSLKPLTRTRPKKENMFFYAYVYGGYDLWPQAKADDVLTYFKIYIGDQIVSLDTANLIPGKYPRWCFEKKVPLQLRADVSYESNLNFVLYQKGSYLGLKTREIEIGSFRVPLTKLKHDWTMPHFFHVIDPAEEGVSQGRILARFHLSKQDLRHNPCVSGKETHKCNIKLALIGIRNLQPKYRDLNIKLSIPGYYQGEGEDRKEAEVIIKPDDPNYNQNNPTLLKIVTLDDIDLPIEPIFLPPINIRVKDDTFLIGNECFTQIPLMKYADWVESDLKKKRAEELYNRNYAVKELIEQVPLIIDEPKQVVKKQDLSFTDYKYSISTKSDADSEDKSEEEEERINFDDIFEPKNNKIFKKIQFDKDTDDEKLEQQKLIEADIMIESELEELNAKKKEIELKDKIPPESLLQQIRDLNAQKRIIEEGPMTERKFNQIADEFDEDDGFQYTRPVLKNVRFEETLELPYERFLLYKITKNSKMLSSHRVGEPTGAVFKIIVKVIPQSSIINFDEQDPYENETEEEKRKELPVDFFHPLYDENQIAKVFDPSQTFTIRVYLLRGQSLSAVYNSRDLPALAAGLDAMSSVDSYPEIIIGEKTNDNQKYINDSKQPEVGQLNPDYFRTYVMSATFPEDWQMTINILNQGSLGFDSVIGSTSIDLEDRYYGNSSAVRRKYLQSFKDHLSDEIDAEKDQKRRNMLNSCKKKVKHWLIKAKAEEMFSPVEFRALIHPKRLTAQGILELYTDVLDSKEAKLIPLERIAKPIPEKYEMRLVIWRCEGLPKGDKEYLSIMFLCQFNPSGWEEEAISQDTDVHNGSADGHGEFNWRMKFNFQLPCAFARLRIVALNFSTFGTDEVISEEIMDLSRYFRILNKEGKFSTDEEWLPMHVPNKHNVYGGKVCVSIQLLSQAEADQRPVGNGRDEPNRDPELETPLEGRGISDFLKGTALDIGFNFNFGLIKKLLALLVMLFTAIVLFVYPGIMIK